MTAEAICWRVLSALSRTPGRSASQFSGVATRVRFLKTRKVVTSGTDSAGASVRMEYSGSFTSCSLVQLEGSAGWFPVRARHCNPTKGATELKRSAAFMLLQWFWKPDFDLSSETPAVPG